MSRVPWEIFKDRQIRAHLVAATVQADSADLREVQIVLRSLVRKQEPTGAYATTIMREAGRLDVHLAFEEEGDARKLAAVVQTEATGGYPGWATQRAVQLDGAMFEALVASLPVPKRSSRQPPEAGSTPWRRSRYSLPRAPYKRAN
jgi:hypothetical protein